MDAKLRVYRRIHDGGRTHAADTVQRQARGRAQEDNEKGPRFLVKICATRSRLSDGRAREVLTWSPRSRALADSTRACSRSLRRFAAAAADSSDMILEDIEHGPTSITITYAKSEKMFPTLMGTWTIMVLQPRTKSCRSCFWKRLQMCAAKGGIITDNRHERCGTWTEAD